MTTTLQKRRGASGRASTQGTFHILAMNSPYGTICQCYVRELPFAVRNHISVSTFGGWGDIKWPAIREGQSGNTLLVCRLADIPEDIKALGTGGNKRRHLVFVEDMPVEAIPSRVPRLNVRDARDCTLLENATLMLSLQ